MEQPKRRGLKTTRSEWKQRFPYIPDDLLEANILPRLPVETLLRFRCVSKKWLHLISRTKVQKKEKLMISTEVERNHRDKIIYVFTSVDTEKKSQKVGEYDTDMDEYELWRFRGGCLKILGSCNGLLLIREYEDLFLWNPTIRYCKRILSYHRLADEGYSVVGGLCFDSYNNDYKVVLMLSHQTPSYGGKFATVGSSKTQDWKRIDFPYKFSSVVNGPAFNNYLHWIASPKKTNQFMSPHASPENSNDFSPENSNDSSPENSNEFMSPHCIIYYDPIAGEFARFLMPDPIESAGDIIFGLGVLDGCFCMTRAEDPGKCGDTFQVLVMKEYGVKESWTVMFLVEPVSGLVASHVPLFYTREKREVLMYFDGDVVAYDLTKKSIRYIEYGEEAVVYEETMVQPVEYVSHREGVCVEDGIIWERNEHGYWFHKKVRRSKNQTG